MKRLLLVSVLLLNGCAITNLLPKHHDTAEAAKLTDLKVDIEKVSCNDKKEADWAKLIEDARWLDVYTAWRDDPQQKAVTEFYIAAQKARDGSPAYCEATIKLNRTRLQVIESAWKGRS